LFRQGEEAEADGQAIDSHLQLFSIGAKREVNRSASPSVPIWKGDSEVRAKSLVHVGVSMGAIAVALSILTSCSSLSNLLRGRTMAKLEDDIETKWIYSSTWKQESLSQFEVQFGKPDVLDTAFSEGPSNGAGSRDRQDQPPASETALYYQCSDGLLVLFSNNVPDTAGHRTCRLTNQSDCFEIDGSAQLKGEKARDVKSWAGARGSWEKLHLGYNYSNYNLHR